MSLQSLQEAHVVTLLPTKIRSSHKWKIDDRETNAERSILDKKKPGDIGRNCNTNTIGHYEPFCYPITTDYFCGYTTG